MKSSITLLIAMCLAAGCATYSHRHHPEEGAGAGGAIPVVEARVAVVNEEHGFVVLEFPAGGRPAPGSVLEVYRGDRLVGRVQISEPIRGVFATGNMLSGVPQLGDRVRPGGL